MERTDKPVYIYPTELIEDISLRASERNDFKNVVKGAKSKIEAIRKTRELLPQLFPEIENLPPGQRTDVPTRIGGRSRDIFGKPVANDYLVAKSLVDLLWEK